ncbi:Aste57867_16419 [Aphanomyces stellatus]|uniref:subtilisin n=1 Tax=Aphanomyces stellatus TaxID=120398 RepID=A0A485L6D8_9STRA|nr:hypothetical protein As57867_016362 [Aphanomyces stellatus]VFT93194.1 Aste57867_16419 [Aphanomyces stellatus]
MCRRFRCRAIAREISEIESRARETTSEPNKQPRMRIFTLSLLLTLQACAAVEWTPVRRADKDALMELHITLHAADPHALPQRLEAVADIRSPHYGHYLTADAIEPLVAPSAAATAAVLGDLSRHNATTSGPVVTVALPVSSIESLFSTEIHEYEYTTGDRSTSKTALRPRDGRFTLPAAWHSHVLLLEGLEHLPRRPSSSGESHLRSHGNSNRRRRLQITEQTPAMTIGAIQDAYNFPRDLDSSVKGDVNGVVIGAFLAETYDETDLATYMQYNNLPPVRAMPTALGCHGHGAATSEASLDVQLLMGLTRNNATTVMCFTDTRDPTRKISDDNQEPFLKFMRRINAIEPAPAIVSLSYDDDEVATPAAFRVALDREFMRAGLRGTTVVAASGDNGVVGSRRLEVFGLTYCDRYQVLYPGSSPYLVSVGSTILRNSSTDGLSEIGLSITNGGAITTTGGFSDYAPRPTYQTHQVDAYLEAHARTQDLYNPHGRAVPDVAMVGHNIPIFVNGGMAIVDGTSASAPIFAALVSHMNRVRLGRGRAKMGFVTPYLYELHRVCPFLFHDVVAGSNGCGAYGQPCCGNGFAATPGWDPVTGLGTFNFGQWETHVDACEAKMRQTMQ